jgi:hypothetical protein
MYSVRKMNYLKKIYTMKATPEEVIRADETMNDIELEK